MKLKYTFLYIVSIFIIVSCNNADVKPDFAKGFIKYYGNSIEPSVASKVEVTNDGGYILIGTSSSFGNKTPQMYLVKTDRYGNIEWERNYGGVGIDSGRAVKQTNDGGYILLGSYQSTVSGKSFSSMYLVKTDEKGDTAWTRLYNESNNTSTYGLDLSIGVDGSSYLIAGYIAGYHSGSNIGVHDSYIKKIKSNGDVDGSFTPTISPNRYPNSIIEIASNIIYWFGSGGLLSSSDSKVPTPIIAGLNSTGSFFAYDKTAPNIKVDTAGNDASNMVNASAATITSDNGYIIVGTSINNGIASAYLMKLGAVGGGNYVINKFFKQFGDTKATYGASVIESKDGGYVMVGSIANSEDPTAGGGFDIYVVKIDKYGNKLWEKTFGGPSDDFGMSIKQSQDGGYIIAATMSLITSPVNNNVICLIKIDDKGVIGNK